MADPKSTKVKTCAHCGATFINTKKPMARSCSKQCAGFVKRRTLRATIKGKYRGIKLGGRNRLSHEVIAERALGRPLPESAQVHHVDENKHNNTNSNLVICQDQKYHCLLHVRARIVRAGGNPNTHAICSKCKALKARGEFSLKRASANGITNYCRRCMSAWRTTYARPSKASASMEAR